MSEPLSIAQVVASPWDGDDDVVLQARLIADGLAARGHRVVVLAPALSAAAAARSARELKRAVAAGESDSLLPEPGGEPRLIEVGEALALGSKGRRSLPAGVTRALEATLDVLPLDLIQLHDPLPPSLPVAAMRTSRALNIGHFHQAEPRFPAGNVGRRVGGVVYGRLDAAICSWECATPIVREAIPADTVQLLPAIPGITAERDSREGSPPVIGCLALEERTSMRLLLRALRKCTEAVWSARIAVPSGQVPATELSPSLRDRVSFVEVAKGGEQAFLAGIDIAVIGPTPSAPRPLDLIRAIAAGAVPVASAIPAHDGLLEGGQLGPAFMTGDAQTLAAHLTALAGDPGRRRALVGAAARTRSLIGPDHLAREIEAICRDLVSRRHDRRARPAVAKRIKANPMIDVDLHMHTDHSYDCATPVEVLLAQARAQGLGAIAITDHNEISGALEARSKASGIKVIVGEEVKTADQGEVIGLFLEELIPAGLTLAETIDRIHAQGGIAYVPHPFDRLHSVPDYRHLLDSIGAIDALEVHNARVAIGEFNEEAARFAAKYRIPAGAGSDAHVAQGLGSVRIRMRDFDGPDEFLESLREADIVRRPSSLLYVQALKFIQTKATPAGAQKASKKRRVRRAARKS